MKDIVKHKIDVLMEKAKAGDADSQLKLANEFVEGKLVEKSLENAMYWSFKAINGGNHQAVNYYNNLVSGKVESLSKSTYKEILYKLMGYLGMIPPVEMVLGLIGVIFTSSKSVLSLYSLAFLLLGSITMLLVAWLCDTLESLFSNHGSEKSIFLIITATHILALYLTSTL